MAVPHPDEGQSYLCRPARTPQSRRLYVVCTIVNLKAAVSSYDQSCCYCCYSGGAEIVSFCLCLSASQRVSPNVASFLPASFNCSLSLLLSLLFLFPVVAVLLLFLLLPVSITKWLRRCRRETEKTLRSNLLSC